MGMRMPFYRLCRYGVVVFSLAFGSIPAGAFIVNDLVEYWNIDLSQVVVQDDLKRAYNAGADAIVPDGGRYAVMDFQECLFRPRHPDVRSGASSQGACGDFAEVQFSGAPFSGRAVSGASLGIVPLAFSDDRLLNGPYVEQSVFPAVFPPATPGRYNGTALPVREGDVRSLCSSVARPVVPEPSSGLIYVALISAIGLQVARKRYHGIRRYVDVAIALVSLVITAPLLLVAAIAIKLDSPGPVFYAQVRVGYNRRRRQRRARPAESTDPRTDDTLGKPFAIYKLRTMRTDAETGTGAVWAKQNDARVTRVGRILRKTRLDEIPQFFNVLRGDMCIIGPRPERPEFVQKLNAAIPYYYRRFDMPPGITGLAQVRDAYAADIQQTRRKLKYDLLYVRKKGIIMDAQIFFGTISTVVLGKGAR